MTLRLVDIEQHVDLPAAFEDRRLWDESLRNGTLSPYYDACQGSGRVRRRGLLEGARTPPLLQRHLPQPKRVIA